MWHGSPHLFEKFLLKYLGTGEGAQAFGWGLYFAERLGIADSYRRDLTMEAARILLDGKPVDEGMFRFLGDPRSINDSIAESVGLELWDEDTSLPLVFSDQWDHFRSAALYDDARRNSFKTKSLILNTNQNTGNI